MPAGELTGQASNALKVIDGSSVSSGSLYSCALLEGGVVKCWGRNEAPGFLGTGDIFDRGDSPNDMGNSLYTVRLGEGRTVTSLNVGNSHTCAVLDNGAVKCWGYNSSGQLGTGDITNRGATATSLGDNLPAVNLGTGRTAKAVAAGNRHTCAILDTDQVKCWGANASGALGIGEAATTRSAIGDLGDSLPTVNLGTGRTAKAIATGTDFSCAILDTNQVKCWGQNQSGQLGQDDMTPVGNSPATMGDNLPPINLGAGRTAKQLALGGWVACAILDTDEVKCWGQNDKGQAGQGTTSNIGDASGEMASLAPVNLGFGRRALAIAAGASTVCALLDSNQLKCWGENTFGQLGQGDTQSRGDAAGEMGDQLPAVFLGTNMSAIGVSVGTKNVCAVLPSRAVECWGSNENGALGEGSLTPTARGDEPSEMGSHLIPVNLGTRGSKSISVGNDFTCTLLSDNSVRCWGLNSLGQLGMGDTVTRGNSGDLSPVERTPLGSGLVPAQIASRYSSSCVVFADGRMKCWGTNSQGELGLGHRNTVGDGPGEMGSSLAFVNLGTGRTVKKVAMGGGFSCALLDNNQVKCWGANESGQLGQGDMANRGDDANEMGDSLPFVNLGTGRTVLSLAVGTNHACAILDNSRVKCWGWNFSAQLGSGDLLNRGDAPGEMGDALPFVDLGSGRTAKAISVGAFHSCALLDTNQIKCWGYNNDGAAGLESATMFGDAAGEMGDSLPTVKLGTDRYATNVVAATFGTCAILDTGDMKCWGKNERGVLGLGDTRTRGAQLGDMGDGLATVFLGADRKVIAAAGSTHMCALLSTGEIKCWGKNTNGQLGIGDTSDRGDSRSEAGFGYEAVEAGLECSCTN